MPSLRGGQPTWPYSPIVSRRTLLTFVAGSALLFRSRTGHASSNGFALYRGNAARTGEIDDLGPVQPPSERWRNTTGSTVSAAPLIVGPTLYAGDLAGTLLALAADDGREIWSYKTGVAIWSSAALAGDTVFVGNEDGVVFAISAVSGEKRWSFETDENIESSPAVVDGVVCFGGWDGRVYALDQNDGSERWSRQIGSMVRASPAVADGVVYAPSDSDGVFALDLQTGEPIWHFSERPILGATTAALSEGLLYVVGAADGDLVALNLADGSLAWQIHLDELSTPAPAVAQGLVYSASEGFNQQSGQYTKSVQAHDARTGEPVWSYEPLDFAWADPLIASEILYLSDISGTIYALDAGNGAELWTYGDATLQGGQINVHNGTLYSGTRNGFLALA